MVFKRSFLLVLAIGFIRGSLPAQEKTKPKPNFSGVWILDEKKSKKLFEHKPKKGEPVVRTTTTITIKHVEPELTIDETTKAEVLDSSGAVLKSGTSEAPRRIYYTDDRGEKNFLSASKEFASRTHWKDNKLVISTYVDKMNSQWSFITLNKDGTEMTIIAVTYAVTGEQKILGQPGMMIPNWKRVYRKVN